MGDAPLFKIGFLEEFLDYDEERVYFRVKSKRVSAKNPPKIDVTKPFQYKVTRTGQEYAGCLKFSDPEVRSDNLVLLMVETTPALLAKPDFKEIIKEPFDVEVTVKLEPKRAGEDAEECKGRFQIKLDRPVRIRWDWEDRPSSDSSQWSTHYGEQRIELDPNGQDQVMLWVRAEEFNFSQKQWIWTPDDWEFTHWLAKGDPVNINVVCPKPEPWSDEARGGSQAETKWTSVAELPGPDFPVLNELPYDTTIRVRAWDHGSIRKRFVDSVDADKPHVVEKYIPLRLAVNLEAAVKFEIEDGRQYGALWLPRKEQFVTDGADRVYFKAYVRRKYCTPDKIIKSSKIELKLQPDKDYVLENDTTFQEEGKVRAGVGSSDMIPHDAGPPEVTLRVEAKWVKPSGTEVPLEPLDQALEPLAPEYRIEWEVTPEELLEEGSLSFAEEQTDFQLSIWIQVNDNGKWKYEEVDRFQFMVTFNPAAPFTGNGDPATGPDSLELITKWRKKADSGEGTADTESVTVSIDAWRKKK
jgi:hypothetical protein